MHEGPVRAWRRAADAGRQWTGCAGSGRSRHPAASR